MVIRQQCCSQFPLILRQASRRLTVRPLHERSFPLVPLSWLHERIVRTSGILAAKRPCNGQLVQNQSIEPSTIRTHISHQF